MSGPPVSETLDPRDWHLAIRVTAMPADTNAYGDIFGGWLMSQADIAGSTVAIQIAGGRIATVAVKEFRFVAPVLVGDLVNLYARLVGVGRSSITVEIDAWAQREPDPSSIHQVAMATFTYVAVGPDGRPRPIQPDTPAAP
ncbi:acyl-CoA thioesterase [Thiococcus pfennigii]|jgi:acyl-CoA thioesterase YciA|uniref:acyl-CoA thioesterase n=1 Tax=Thiococcus pfennigii TaxID=1057 RepID=UPI0019083B60|nr:acyl-CoA thioesterase [Thiococcus pfennigii]MBK1733217.1 acyl-CoA thioesterase [Thiococcus pfennigii]